MAEEFTVGELARRTGITVRTLHHYHAVGLLSPARRSGSGYRLYGPTEVARLHHIRALKRLGLGLDQIGAWLDRDGMTAAEVLDAHIVRVAEEHRRSSDLLARLEELRAGMAAGGGVSTQAYLETIREVVDMDQYYTPEQLEQLRQRGEALGQEAIEAAQNRWVELFALLREAMAAGREPADEPVQEVAREALGLVAQFTGGDPGTERSLGNMYRKEGTRPLTENGMDVTPELWGFLNRAMAIARDEAK